jgi:hypothetical protein
MNQVVTCDATIEFADDHGVNPTTFHCELLVGHEGKHQETGDMDGTPYTLTWG